MTEQSLSSAQIQELTTAITRLLPAIQSLEALLADATEDATEQQQKMTEMMERLTLALEALVTHQDQIVSRLTLNNKLMAATQNNVTTLSRDIAKEAQGREALKAQIADLTSLLRSPA